ncbi:hypothetical protein [[Flexibacter] sp. ATCC 35208]|uniref:hypothetical protein n=1 Tax=[Flexibacter] sp. ATCC 35208 TaxID=1936242 RepID=UPI0009D3ACA5|nr:hypothetical protein [[Flexibacter] sp. ATCC 35208]OMP76148.1 hypothetical protein BW716_26520 [[Flexibacter] sp. ATCC 35208]
MNFFQILARNIIRKSFHLSVWTIEQFYDIAVFEEKTRELNNLPEGTLGKDIAACLIRHNLRLVPGYESHDLKHVLLGFQMTPVHEIRLQAFMLGNGNRTIPSLLIFLFGALLLPDLWRTFYHDFKNGTQAKPISTWTIEDYAHCQTSTLREAVFSYAPKTHPMPVTSWITKFGAYMAIFLGTAGMLFCLPFLFSSSIEDIVGAGFPFVGGTIIASAGLIALSNISKPQPAFTLSGK